MNSTNVSETVNAGGVTLQKWLEESYKEFAVSGPNNLKVDRIARQAGITRTSFYHYFVDKDALVSKLLSIHEERINSYLKQLELCNSYPEDVFALMMKFKTEFLFHKQLGINRNIIEFQKLYMKLMENDRITSKLWADYFSIEINPSVAAQTHVFLSESLFNFITPETFDQAGLMNFALRSRTVIRDLIKTCSLKN